MIDTPQITETNALQTAVVHLVIPRDAIQAEMGPAIGEVMSALAAQGIAPTGPMFSRHFRMDLETFDFEVGVPVGSAVAPTGRVVASELPAARVVRTVYCGDYSGLGGGWREFGDWVEANGHKTRGDFWEIYAVGPETTDDPEGWRTELNLPLAEGDEAS